MTIEEMNDIKEARGYSFSQLSEYSGVPVVTLQKIFSGKTKNPRRATLDAIERVLMGEESIYKGKAYEYESVGYPYWNEGESPNRNLKENESVYGNKKQGDYTLYDYYRLPDDLHVELIDGVIYDMTAPLVVHQDISRIIYTPIADFIKKNKGKCKALYAPVDVQLDRDQKTMVQPDVLIVCDRDKIKRFGIYGAPDFVAEILSDSTRKKDLSVKVTKYAEAGVREYWIIDPIKKILIVYNFMDENWAPEIRPLKGVMPVAIFDGKLKISLDEIMESIKEFEEF